MVGDRVAAGTFQTKRIVVPPVQDLAFDGRVDQSLNAMTMDAVTTMRRNASRSGNLSPTKNDQGRQRSDAQPRDACHSSTARRHSAPQDLPRARAPRSPSTGRDPATKRVRCVLRTGADTCRFHTFLPGRHLRVPSNVQGSAACSEAYYRGSRRLAPGPGVRRSGPAAGLSFATFEL